MCSRLATPDAQPLSPQPLICYRNCFAAVDQQVKHEPFFPCQKAQAASYLHLPTLQTQTLPASPSDSWGVKFRYLQCLREDPVNLLFTICDAASPSAAVLLSYTAFASTHLCRQSYHLPPPYAQQRVWTSLKPETWKIVSRLWRSIWFEVWHFGVVSPDHTLLCITTSAENAFTVSAVSNLSLHLLKGCLIFPNEKSSGNKSSEYPFTL